MDLLTIVKERRSVRRFKPDPVPEEALNAVLEAGRWAPSWANTQCCRFIVVKEKETKEKLSTTLSPNNPATGAVKNAPVLIVICAELKKSGYYKGEPVTDKGDWFMFDAGLAAQNMALMAHALGLGTVHVGYFDAPKAAEILAVPEGSAVVEILPLGYPEEVPKAPRRKELAEIVFYEKYGQGQGS